MNKVYIFYSFFCSFYAKKISVFFRLSTLKNPGVVCLNINSINVDNFVRLCIKTRLKELSVEYCLDCLVFQCRFCYVTYSKQLLHYLVAIDVKVNLWFWVILVLNKDSEAPLHITIKQLTSETSYICHKKESCLWWWLSLHRYNRNCICLCCLL